MLAEATLSVQAVPSYKTCMAVRSLPYAEFCSVCISWGVCDVKDTLMPK